MTDLSETQPELALEFLAGGGEMGALMRAHDWSKSPLGDPHRWPDALKMAVSICLNSRFPMVLWWGSDFVMLYNDAWRPVLGATKHPGGLGRPGVESWPEIWDTIGEQMRGVLNRGEASWSEDLLLVLERYGYREEAYFTYSYSPIKDTKGRIGGVFSAVSETTDRVLSERRLRILRELAERTADAKNVEAACATFAQVLGNNNPDLPFSALYLVNETGDAVRRQAMAGFHTGDDRAPPVVTFGSGDPWHLADVVRRGQPVLVEDLAATIGDLPGGAWPEPASSALVIPISKAGQDAGITGALIAGINPRRRLDGEYRNFLELVASHMATAVANARAYDEERKRAEALAEIDRAKTAFFSNVSHEFRTPLALMLGPIEDALNDVSESLSSTQRERIEVAQRNSLRLLRLVNNLLDFSRIEAGRVRARFEPTDLAAYTAELASSFEPATTRAGLKLTVQCRALPEPVYIDREMWEKIVLNLLSNAFKFTFDGEIAVHIQSAADRSSAELVVSDTGTGIAEHEMPHLFKRFHRIENAKGRTFEGSGIGLALVRELVEQLGGSIRVESRLGRGTTFRVTLPFGKAHLPGDRVVSSSSGEVTKSRADAFVQEALRWLPDDQSIPVVELADATEEVGSQVQAERVLLVDDNADMREYVRRLLSDQGYIVEAVGDGEAAFNAARMRRPDLVLSDVMMPGVDGFGLVAKLRADLHLREMPVILLSARAGEEARIEGLDAGADDYISKPFSARELLARIRANLQLARIRREADDAQRRYAARLEAVINTVPTGVWFTDDPEAKRIFGNAYGAALLGLPPHVNVSLSAPPQERPRYRVFRNGRELAPHELPLQRAVLGETIKDEELEIRLEDGSTKTLVFQAAPILNHKDDIQGAVCGAIDITDRKRQERHRELLINELNHRVKNTLATIQSFAAQTLRNASSLSEGRAAFDARIIALSKAHDVLVRENWESATIEEIVTAGVAAYTNSNNSGFTYGGPEIRLRPKGALAISMVLHELATNAVKYGALSAESGAVDITWRFADAADTFELRWKESGGPTVIQPIKRGFGSRLIEKGLAHELGGSARLEFLKHGLVCTIVAPLKNEVNARD